MTAPTSDRILPLDGLRAIAVVAVLCHHLWPTLAPGGFVGVSVFFTLSGFVITRRLIRECENTGRVDLRAFWVRRARRLLPASLATLLAVTIVWGAAGWSSRRIGHDLLASLGQVANWRFIVTGREYGADRDSPVAHFWSLAVEEQFYLVVPIVFMFLGRRRRLLVASVSATVIAAVLTTLAWSGDPSLVYHSTPTRAGEIALGVLLAVAMDRRLPSMPPRRTFDLLGAIALATVVIATLGGRLDQGLWYRGGLVGFGVVSCAVLLGALKGPTLARALAWKPLVHVGQISYGIYLVHWPIDVALRRVFPVDPVRPWIALAATVVAAAASHRFIENPAMSGRVRGRPLALTSATAAACVACLALVVHVPRTAAIDYDTARENFDLVAESAPPGPAAGGAPRLRVGIFGDSTALMLSTGFDAGDPDVGFVTGYAVAGCPLGRDGRVRGDPTVPDSFVLGDVAVPAECDWTTGWAEVLRKRPADVAVVLVGNWDLMERSVPSLAGWHRIGDEPYDSWLASEVRAAAETLLAGGAGTVAWLTLPPPSGVADDAVTARFNDIVAAALAGMADVRVLDYAGHLSAAGDDATMRPDGTHLSTDTAPTLVRRWLVPALTASANG